MRFEAHLGAPRTVHVPHPRLLIQSAQAHEAGALCPLLLQVRKARLGEVKQHAPGHTAWGGARMKARADWPASELPPSNP